MPVKAIETHYNGYRFRSRLEARWAVFFDHLGTQYEYEPEGFQLSDGTRYLPDFRIQTIKRPVYIEVKGQHPGQDYMQMLCRFSAEIRNSVAVLIGTPGDELFVKIQHMSFVEWAKTDINNSDLGALMIVDAFKDSVIHIFSFSPGEHSGGWTSYSSEHGNGNDYSKAYEVARSARFEHGAKGR